PLFFSIRNEFFPPSFSFFFSPAHNTTQLGRGFFFCILVFFSGYLDLVGWPWVSLGFCRSWWVSLGLLGSRRVEVDFFLSLGGLDGSRRVSTGLCGFFFSLGVRVRVRVRV